MYYLISLVTLSREQNNVALIRNVYGKSDGFLAVRYRDIWLCRVKISQNIAYYLVRVFVVGIVGGDYGKVCQPSRGFCKLTTSAVGSSADAPEQTDKPLW